MAKPRGIALMTSLLLISFLLVIGLGFLTMVQRDYSFGRQQQVRQQAFFLAQSGLDFYRQRPALFTANAPLEFGVPNSDTDRRFEVTLLSDGTVRSRGIVKSHGKVLGERILIAPGGDFSAVYDDSR